VNAVVVLPCQHRFEFVGRGVRAIEAQLDGSSRKPHRRNFSAGRRPRKLFELLRSSSLLAGE